MTISNFVAYVKQAWKNKPDTSTPLSAPRLLHMEDGIKMTSDAIEKIAAAVVSQIVNDPNKIASMAALYAVDQKIGNVANLPNSAADVVTAITQQNSNLQNLTNNFNEKINCLYSYDGNKRVSEIYASMNSGSVIIFNADGNTEIGKELGNYEPNLSHIILLYKRESWRGFAIAVGMNGTGNNSSDFFVGQISGENSITWKAVAMKQ